jgi:ABC-type antimicrobial peptide transport system permease subunit
MGFFFIILPIILGLIVALVNSSEINGTLDKISSSLRDAREDFQQSNAWYVRSILLPINKGAVRFLNWTEKFGSRLKNGLRAAVGLFAVSFFVWLFFLAFRVALVVGVVALILYLAAKAVRSRTPKQDLKEDLQEEAFIPTQESLPLPDEPTEIDILEDSEPEKTN